MDLVRTESKQDPKNRWLFEFVKDFQFKFKFTPVKKQTRKEDYSWQNFVNLDSFIFKLRNFKKYSPKNFKYWLSRHWFEQLKRCQKIFRSSWTISIDIEKLEWSVRSHNKAFGPLAVRFQFLWIKTDKWKRGFLFEHHSWLVPIISRINYVSFHRILYLQTFKTILIWHNLELRFCSQNAKESVETLQLSKK